MSQPRSVTVDEIIAYLRSGEKPVYTTSDIAAEFDVSTETVRRRMPEVVEDEAVSEDSIGKANVYWSPDRSDPPHSAEPNGPATAEPGEVISETPRSGQDTPVEPTTRHPILTDVRLVGGASVFILLLAFMGFVNVIAAAAFSGPFFGLWVTSAMFLPAFFAAGFIPVYVWFVSRGWPTPPGTKSGVSQ